MEEIKTKNLRRKNRGGMDMGRALLWSAVVVEAPRWAGAMLAADTHQLAGWLSVFLNAANTISGLAMGLVNVVSTAYMLDALRRERPTITVHRKAGNFEKRNWRFMGLLLFVGGLLVLTPFVLAPFIVSRMTGDTMAASLGDRLLQYAWAVMVVVSPIFVIGGVAFAHPGLVKMGNQGSGNQGLGNQVEGEGGRSPEGNVGRRKVSAGAPEGEPVFRDFREVPESEYEYLLNAPTALITKKFRIGGRDPERVARAWRSSARAKLAERAQQGGLFDVTPNPFPIEGRNEENGG